MEALKSKEDAAAIRADVPRTFEDGLTDLHESRLPLMERTCSARECGPQPGRFRRGCLESGKIFTTLGRSFGVFPQDGGFSSGSVSKLVVVYQLVIYMARVLLYVRCLNL